MKFLRGIGVSQGVKSLSGLSVGLWGVWKLAPEVFPCVVVGVITFLLGVIFGAFSINLKK